MLTPAETLRKNKHALEQSLIDTLAKFEKENGQDIITSISLLRYGSDNSLCKVKTKLEI